MNNTHKVRQWAENFKADSLYGSTMDELVAAADHILATTTPPTMADIEWDDDKHYLAGATTPDDTDCVMIWSDLDLSGDIVCDDSAWRPDQLTPNGKRYKLVEVTDKPEEGEPTVSSGEKVGPDQPNHPETLTTVEDYENAPEGTIVALSRFAPYVKKLGGSWSNMTGRRFSEERLAGTSRKVLRWGWGE